MFLIGEAVVDEEIAHERFTCDLIRCKGACSKTQSWSNSVRRCLRRENTCQTKTFRSSNREDSLRGSPEITSPPAWTTGIASSCTTKMTLHAVHLNGLIRTGRRAGENRSPVICFPSVFHAG